MLFKAAIAASLRCGADSRKTRWRGYSETINDPILWAILNAIKKQQLDPSKIPTHKLTHRKLILATPYSDWQPPLRM
jgi:hypothetical protein